VHDAPLQGNYIKLLHIGPYIGLV